MFKESFAFALIRKVRTRSERADSSVNAVAACVPGFALGPFCSAMTLGSEAGAGFL